MASQMMGVILSADWRGWLVRHVVVVEVVYILRERRRWRMGLAIGISVESRVGLLLCDAPSGSSEAALMSLVVLVRRAFGLLRWHSEGRVDGLTVYQGWLDVHAQDEPGWRTGARYHGGREGAGERKGCWVAVGVLLKLKKRQCASRWETG